jgi:S-DNA-T family DNA segregation ATPase FtsK/SpoIIIE
VLEQTLSEFHIDAQVVEAETGPVITMFELQLAPGIKVAQISNLSNDLARSLGAAAVRVVAPLPGKHTIGIEVPNNEKEKVRIKELLQLGGEKATKMHIPLFLGKDASGDGLIVDLTSLPHLLIAGTTGSGKSVCINAIITSILLTQRPDMVKLILVDPKMVEMNAFRDLPHLMCPIVTEMKRAEQILEWLTVKMDERYALLAEARVRNIAGYNQLTEEQIYERFCPSNEEEKTKIPLRLPYLVIIIDELADLMMTSAKEVEGYIIRVAQKSRAVGIHIVLATQRPQATVVTGLIKSNLPSRISFRVAARMDSRIVLDQNGAEALLGLGDMLFLQPGTSDLVRAQGTYISDNEIHRIMKFLKEVAQPSYHPELVQLNHVATGDMEKDELFDEAVQIVLETRRGSVSLLQRRLTIGYSRASRLIDQMAMAGIVGEYKGSQAREVLITPSDFEAIKKQMQIDSAKGYRDLQEDDQEHAVPEITGAGSNLPVIQVKVKAQGEPDQEWDESEEVKETEETEDEEEYEEEEEDDSKAALEDDEDNETHTG